MLRWRLPLGTMIIATLVALCWLDYQAEADRPEALPGFWLLPVVVIFAVTATRETLHLAAEGGMRPVPWAVYAGNLLLLASNWVPWMLARFVEGSPPVAPIAWPYFALTVAVLLVFVGQMQRFREPGGATASLAAGVFSLVYVGVMLCFAVQLRLQWGIGALASLVIVVKLGDTGAYTVGRLLGRHKMAPVISPGKTVEGAAGALLFACLGSCATFGWLVPLVTGEGVEFGPWWAWILFGLAVGAAGILGDLAESLIKRDVGCKDSSRWLPGFGGVLDILDSILVAAPVAWLCWALAAR